MECVNIHVNIHIHVKSVWSVNVFVLHVEVFRVCERTCVLGVCRVCASTHAAQRDPGT